MAANHRPSRNTEISKLNIGVVIFLVFVVYIAINLFLFATKSHLSVYEVQSISLSSDNHVEGLILRDETIIPTEKAGYVNYYMKGGTRVSKNETVYSIDDNKQIYDMISETDLSYSLTEQDTKSLKQIISNYNNDYGNLDYSQIYSLADLLNSKIKNISDSYLLENLNTILETTGYSSALSVYKTPSAGIISYFSDDYDSLTIDDVTPKIFEDRSDYKSKNLFDTELKEKGSSVYKLLTNENWTLILNLTKEQYEALSSRTKLTLTIDYDHLTITQGVTFYTMNNGYFARLDMDKYLVRYVDERFLDITINMDSSTGLKIPNTAITEKDFYMIPKDYFVEGQGEDAFGLTQIVYNQETNQPSYQYVGVEIYYEDETYWYIDTSTFTYGTYIVKAKSTDDAVTSQPEQFQISLIGNLEGVYQVNKGYAQFRRIERLYDGDEYCIVQENVAHSLFEYDHIALDASKIEEAEIIY